MVAGKGKTRYVGDYRGVFRKAGLQGRKIKDNENCVGFTRLQS